MSAETPDQVVTRTILGDTSPRCTACDRYINTDTMPVELLVCEDGNLLPFHPACLTLRVETWEVRYPWEVARTFGVVPEPPSWFRRAARREGLDKS